jgi:dipeptidyl aminopeptidase/acylaminoacyl peptidase
VETWQVYGIDGELLAEYAPNASPSSPQKEYGYRNGQLLIIATAPSVLAVNKPSSAGPGAGITDSSAAGTEPRKAANKSLDLLAFNKSFDLRQWPGIGERAAADTSPALDGYSFSFASLLSSLFSSTPQSSAARIAFASNRDGAAQLYPMNTDGSGLVRLTANAANDEAPNWSPDNSRIVFQSDRWCRRRSR